MPLSLFVSRGEYKEAFDMKSLIFSSIIITIKFVSTMKGVRERVKT
jgi:hypothetical protein